MIVWRVFKKPSVRYIGECVCVCVYLMLMCECVRFSDINMSAFEIVWLSACACVSVREEDRERVREI